MAHKSNGDNLKKRLNKQDIFKTHVVSTMMHADGIIVILWYKNQING
jgi:hypothetical protein